MQDRPRFKSSSQSMSLAATMAMSLAATVAISAPRALRSIGVLLGIFLAAPSAAQTTVALISLAEGLEAPSSVTHAGDDRLFITSLDGRVLTFNLADGGTSGTLRPEPFLDLRDRVLFEQAKGLFSIAFHPRFLETSGPGSGFLFAAYSNLAGDFVVARFAADAARQSADPTSEAILLTVPKATGRHNGGQLQFGPDGFLYVASGDGSTREIDPECAALDLDSLEGKLLRLDVDRGAIAPPFHSIPENNPFLGVGRPEIWALGLRNPWRFSFDRETGSLWIGDVGEDTREEINARPASSPGGENYGWKVMEGTWCLGDVSGCTRAVPACGAPQLIEPVLEYGHADGHCSVTGGYVYRGRRVPGLVGRYVYGDFCSGALWAASADPANAASPVRIEELGALLPGVLSFGEDTMGELYALADGVLYRFIDPQLPASGLVELEGESFAVTEDASPLELSVLRIGGGTGRASVVLRIEPESARRGEDFRGRELTLTWPDGDTGERQVALEILDDTFFEGEETFRLELVEPLGIELGARAQAQVTILDDDVPTCRTDATHLCLNRGRFRVSVDWRTPAGERGAGQAVPQGDDVGAFYFFSPNNLELFIKLLDGCFDPFNHFWFFAAGLTNVETRIQVVDTVTGQERIYERPLGVPFEAVQDLRAFATCP